MMNSIDFYQGIFLYVISVPIIVPWLKRDGMGILPINATFTESNVVFFNNYPTDKFTSTRERVDQCLVTCARKPKVHGSSPAASYV